MKDIVEFIENDNIDAFKLVIEAELSRITMEQIQSLAEEDKSVEDIIGTTDDPALSPDYEKEYFLKRLDVKGNNVVLKKLGLGSSAPVSTYINDQRYEIFTTPDQAERETKKYIEDGSYDKKVKEQEEKKKQLEAQKKEEESKKQESEEPKEVKESDDLPLMGIDEIRLLQDTERPALFRFRNGEERIMTAEEASRVLEIYDLLNIENKSRFASTLENNQKDYQKMMSFFLNNMTKGII